MSKCQICNGTKFIFGQKCLVCSGTGYEPPIYNTTQLGLEMAQRILQERDAVLEQVETLQTELDQYRKDEAKICEYKLYRPSEHGYDEEGYFYECSCRASYINIKQAIEWDYCPHCGKKIGQKETVACVTCKYAIDDGYTKYCEHPAGVYRNDYVDDKDFDGCEYYEQAYEQAAREAMERDKEADNGR